eukprot:CAMPEP_0175632752 /NCGR_PEP_ID=MMETSP0097-20121207/286_1 /TAXON_ID=311494 /ORGANISM="Alexandrium monilatum, Strain CCMP3105" /LENGTH=45 /DNA_ID= /DNA_START= /DNA_END= /DNA_ORIENTATION=
MPASEKNQVRRTTAEWQPRLAYAGQRPARTHPSNGVRERGKARVP